MWRAVLVVSFALLAAVDGGSAAAGEAPTSTTGIPASEGGGIIPEPNSGAEPQDAGDRGGAAQTALFFVVVGGVGLIGFLAYRSSLKARRSGP